MEPDAAEEDVANIMSLWSDDQRMFLMVFLRRWANSVRTDAHRILAAAMARLKKDLMLYRQEQAAAEAKDLEDKAIATLLESNPGERSAEQIDIIHSWLSTVDVVNFVEPEHQREAFAMLKIKKYDAGVPIMSYGEESTFFAIIIDGEVTVYVSEEMDAGAANDEGLEYTLTRWKYFGELELLQNEARKATCVAKTACTCLVVGLEPWNIFFKEHYEHLNTLPEKVDALKVNNLFPNARDEDLEKFSYSCIIAELPARHVLAKQNDPAMTVYLVLRGELAVTHVITVGKSNAQKFEIELSKFPKGSLFGDIESMNDEATYKCRAVCATACRVLIMERRVLIKLVDHEEKKSGKHNHIRREAVTKKRFRDQRLNQEKKRVLRMLRNSSNAQGSSTKDLGRIDTPLKNENFLRMRRPMGSPLPIIASNLLEDGTASESATPKGHPKNPNSIVDRLKNDMKRRDRSSASVLEDMVHKREVDLTRSPRRSFNNSIKDATAATSQPSSAVHFPGLADVSSEGSAVFVLPGFSRSATKSSNTASPEDILIATRRAMQDAGVA